MLFIVLNIETFYDCNQKIHTPKMDQEKPHLFIFGNNKYKGNERYKLLKLQTNMQYYKSTLKVTL